MRARIDIQNHGLHDLPGDSVNGVRIEGATTDALAQILGLSVRPLDVEAPEATDTTLMSLSVLPCTV